MHFRVLGNSSRYLSPLGAGTSYLLESTSGARVVLDCGNGTHTRLARILGGAKVDAVLVSHFHVDNAADLLPILFGGVKDGAPLFLPRGADLNLAHFLKTFDMDRSWIDRVRVDEVSPGDLREVGDIALTFGDAHHGCPGVSLRAEADGRSLVYLADTGPRASLAGFAKRADVILAHTLLTDREADGVIGETNLSAGAAGRLARDAQAGRLALSHVPFYRAAEESLAEARAAFGGDAFLVQEDSLVEV